ncbi:MAG: hypothetical protein IPM76_24325 [Chloroflexi bacterium]|nr:hypothetical protein [Chloroflexota bacterium]
MDAQQDGLAGASLEMVVERVQFLAAATGPTATELASASEPVYEEDDVPFLAHNWPRFWHIEQHGRLRPCLRFFYFLRYCHEPKQTKAFCWLRPLFFAFVSPERLWRGWRHGWRCQTVSATAASIFNRLPEANAMDKIKATLEDVEDGIIDEGEPNWAMR